MTRVFIKALLIAAVLCVATTLSAQSTESLLDAFSPASGWKPDGPRKTYAANDIDTFDPSMTLKRYGARGATTQAWSGPSGHVIATLIEMVDSPAAYGAFSIRRDINAPGYSVFPFGAEGVRRGRQATFWKGPFLIQLEGDQQAMEEWAALAASKITVPSLKPPVSNYLPTERRVEGSDKYIVGAANVEGMWDFDPARLGFEKSAEAATATYEINGKPVRLLLIMYPTQQVAKQFEEALAATSGGGVRFKKRSGPLLAIVDPGADQAIAETLLGEINHEFKVTWNERRPGPNIADVVLTIFKFIGIALAATLITGIAFGALRVLVKRWFPGRVFDRPQDMEVTQLNLIHIVRGLYRRPDDPPSRRPGH